MTGPYVAKFVTRRGEPVLEMTEEELESFGRRTAERFYQWATPGLVEGALRSAVFSAAGLLERGEEVVIEIHGLVGGQPTVCRTATARRDESGAFLSNLGSRFNERVFRGV